MHVSRQTTCQRRNTGCFLWLFYSSLSIHIRIAQDSPLSQLQVTFAALQVGDQKVFNPTKLVESLQLRTSEQQDAQEYDYIFFP